MSSCDERECVPCAARARRDLPLAVEPGVLVAVEELMDLLGAKTPSDEFEIEVIAGRSFYRICEPCSESVSRS